MTTVKITELSDIGANLASSTVIPVVNMAGTPITQKTNVGNIANLILEGAGVDYAEASVALLAQTVSNAAQPNITSVGTLTNVVVSGNATVNGNITSNGTAYLGNISTTGLASITTLNVGTTANLGSVNNVIIEGGTDGQVLTTDGDGNLSWTTVSSGNSSYGDSNVVTLLSAFGSNTITTTGNVSVGNIIGNGQALTNIAGGNVSGFVPNANVANTAFAVAAANVSGLGNIATINLDGSTSNVLYGNGVFAPVTGGNGTYDNSNVATFLAAFGSNTITTTGNVSVGNLSLAGNVILSASNTGELATSQLGGEGVGGISFVQWTTASELSIRTDNASPFIATFESLKINDSFALLTGGGGAFPANVLVNGAVSQTTPVSGYIDFIIPVDDVPGSNVYVYTFNLTRAPVTEFIQLTGNTINLGNAVLTANGNALVVDSIQLTNGNIGTIGNISNINLTGSTSNVLYGNGVFAPATGGGGGAVISNGTSYANVVSSDGNVVIGVDGDNMTWTFATDRKIYGKLDEDVIIVAVDDGNDSSVRHQVVDDNLDALSQTRLEPGDFYIQFDLDSGGNSWRFDNGSLRPPEGGAFEQFDGNIRMYAMNAGSNPVASLQSVSNQNDPNIFTTIDATTTGANIVVYNGGSNGGVGYTWQFANDGRLTFPGTPRIDTDANNFEVQAAEAISLEANTVVNIYTDAGNTTYQWQFGDDGNLTLPDTTGVLANVSITLEANDTGNITGLSLIGDSNANLYAHGNVTIVSDSSNTTATWSFVNTGDVVLPNDVVIGDDGSNGMMLSVPTVTPGTYSDWTFDQSGNLTLPGYLISTINDSLNATGTVQANAALLSKSYNIVTGSNVSPINGVILPANPIAGTTIVVAPRANTGDIKIYPQLGGTIEYGTINDPLQTIANQPGNIITFVATSSTNWITG